MPETAMGPAQWMQLLISGGLGAVAVALIQRWRGREGVAAIQAAAGKDTAAGAATALAATAEAFTEVTGGLREEIERLQGDALELRDRAAHLETELRAALTRLAELERLLAERDLRIADLEATLARALEDLARAREERDQALGRVLQQEGEIRQLNAWIASRKQAEKE